MKIGIRSLLVLSATILLYSCDEDSYHTVVKGTVINRGNREPIADARVSLKDGVASSFFGVDGNTASDGRVETYSDENGEFEISLRGEHTAFMGVSKENYSCFHVEGRRSSCDEVVPFGDGQHSDIIVTLDAESRFNAIFFSPHARSSDSLRIYVLNSTSDFRIGGGGHCLRSCNSEGKLVPGDFYIDYTLQFTRNGVWQELTDSVYVPSFTTYRDTIYY